VARLGVLAAAARVAEGRGRPPAVGWHRLLSWLLACPPPSARPRRLSVRGAVPRRHALSCDPAAAAVREAAPQAQPRGERAWRCWQAFGEEL